MMSVTKGNGLNKFTDLFNVVFTWLVALIIYFFTKRKTTVRKKRKRKQWKIKEDKKLVLNSNEDDRRSWGNESWNNKDEDKIKITRKSSFYSTPLII